MEHGWIKDKLRGLVTEKRVPDVINTVEVETKNKENKEGDENGDETQEISYIWRQHLLINDINRLTEKRVDVRK